jgi:curved DNA-binding protein CbpA
MVGPVRPRRILLPGRPGRGITDRMNGNLAQRALSDVLAAVQRSQASGVLRIQHEATTRQMFIDAGVTVRFAVSTLPDENITTLFRSSGAMSEEQIRQAATAKQPDELLGTTLVRLGFLPQETLVQLTRDHIHRIVIGALAMRDGVFDFQTGALPFREQIDAGLRTPEVLLEWARAVPSMGWIRRRFGSLDGRVVMSPRPPGGYEKVPLNPAEGFIMSRVDGRSSVGEICMVSPMGEDVTLRALYGLALAGILHLPDNTIEIPLDPAPAPVATPSNAVPAARPRPVAVPAPVAPVPSQAAAAARAPATPPAAVAAARTPTNGGAAPAPSGTQTRPATSAAPAAAKPVAGARPAGPRPAGGGAIRRPGSPLRRVTPIKERARPVTTPDLENEMLQRFEQMRDQDLYQVLGVASGSFEDDVRRAYYTLAKRFHPDKFTREEMKTKAEKVFAHITEAYSTLYNTETRRKYDEDQALRKTAHTEKKLDSGDMARQNFKHGKDLLDKGRPGEAIAFLQNACDQDPSKTEHFHYLAIAQSRNPRWRKDAEENFLKAIERDPTNAELYAALGTLYSKGGLHSKARDQFKKALQWDPANEEALSGLQQEEGGRKGLLGMFKK